MDKVAARIEKIHAKMAAADQSDFEGVMKLTPNCVRHRPKTMNWKSAG